MISRRAFAGSWAGAPWALTGLCLSLTISRASTAQTAQAPVLAASTAAEAEAPENASSGQAPALEEVVVQGQLKSPGATRMTRAEVQNLPGAFGDPLRAVEAMPGVTPIVTGLPLFFVRGAPPGNVGYFVDGIRVPLLYHAFLGPSVIHPALLSEVSLYAGPMPVRFGRYAGAAVEAELARPQGEFRGEAQLRLTDVGAFVEAPVLDGRGYALLAGRYSYTALLISLLAPDVKLDYWDYQGLFGYHLSKQDELSLFVLGAYDYFQSDATTAAGTEYHRADLRYDHDFSPRAHSRIALTLGRDRTRSANGYVSDNSLATRGNFVYRAKDLQWSSTFDVSFDRYKVEVDKGIEQPEVYLALFPTRTDVSGGLSSELVLFPDERVQLIPGLRADLYSSLGNTLVGVDPRVSVRYLLGPRLKASHSLGLAHQTPNFMPGVPGAQVGGLEGGLQEALQADTRYEFSLPWELSAQVAGFINRTERMSDPVGLSQSFTIDETTPGKRALGRAYGLEFTLRRPLTRRFGGFISYTLSRTERSLGALQTIPGYDRPHVLNLALSYDLGASFRLSGKFVLASGIPGRRTTLEGYVYDQSRSAPLVRLDLKLEKRWQLTPSSYLAANLEVLNASHTPSVATRVCGVYGCREEGSTPITLPSLGLEYGWH